MVVSDSVSRILGEVEDTIREARQLSCSPRDPFCLPQGWERDGSKNRTSAGKAITIGG